MTTPALLCCMAIMRWQCSIRRLWHPLKIYVSQQVMDVASGLADETGVPGTAAAAVQVPYRVCPLGAHVDHQASASAAEQSFNLMGSSRCQDGDACILHEAVQSHDVQGGCISGMALDFGITLVFVPRTDRTMHMTSLNFAGVVEFSLDDVPPCRRGDSSAEENCWCGCSVVQTGGLRTRITHWWDHIKLRADPTADGDIHYRGNFPRGAVQALHTRQHRCSVMLQ